MAESKQKDEEIALIAIVLVVIILFVFHNTIIPAKVSPVNLVPSGSQAAINPYTIGTGGNGAISGGLNGLLSANQYNADIAAQQATANEYNSIATNGANLLGNIADDIFGSSNSGDGTDTNDA